MIKVFTKISKGKGFVKNPYNQFLHPLESFELTVSGNELLTNLLDPFMKRYLLQYGVTVYNEASYIGRNRNVVRSFQTPQGRKYSVNDLNDTIKLLLLVYHLYKSGKRGVINLTLFSEDVIASIFTFVEDIGCQNIAFIIEDLKLPLNLKCTYNIDGVDYSSVSLQGNFDLYASIWNGQ